MTLSNKTQCIIIRLIVVIFLFVSWWLIILFVSSCVDRISQHQAQAEEKAKMRQNIPSPPKSMASYRVSGED